MDVDERRVQFARDRGLNALIGTAEDLPFGDASFDVIVSDATLEHLPDIEQALAEARRVLRPGGEFHAMWGPAWLTYNGPHLIKCLSVPWVHLIFSDRTILAALETQKAAERWPTNYIDYKIADFQNMGRLTRRNLRAAARAVGFEILEESSQSRRRSKQFVSRFPVMDELFAGSLFIALRNPT